VNTQFDDGLCNKNTDCVPLIKVVHTNQNLTTGGYENSRRNSAALKQAKVLKKILATIKALHEKNMLEMKKSNKDVILFFVD
jgi:hypothetical protein